MFKKEIRASGVVAYWHDCFHTDFFFICRQTNPSIEWEEDDEIYWTGEKWIDDQDNAPLWDSLADAEAIALSLGDGAFLMGANEDDLLYGMHCGWVIK